MNFFSRAFAVSLLVTSANACVSRATEVTVIVDTDAPRRVLVMRTFVSRGSARSTHPDTHRWMRTGAPTDFAFPASFAVVPGGAPVDQPVFVEVEVELSPRSPGQPSITLHRAARFRFTSHTPTVVRLFIPISCSGDVAPPLHCTDTTVPCTVSRYCDEQGQTCGDDGQCVGIDVHAVEDAGVVAPRDVAEASVEACTPQCGGRTCGPNGCGGSCGSCMPGQTCDASGQCVTHCTPSCTGRQCGTDGCTGSCGTCGAGTRCDEATGQCVCVPNCAGRSCGNDGCGGSCGTCTAPMQCNGVSGACETVCTPNCAGRTCGDDGCTGSCGTCAGADRCSPAGQCFTCSEGSGCATGNECTFGAVACTPSSAVCQSMNRLDGTSCSVGVCIGGNCTCSPRGCDWYGECNPNADNSRTLRWESDGCFGSIQCGACCGSGTFCGASNMLTEWNCGCGNPPAGTGWVDQGGDCWHRFVDPPTSC